jgi:DNA-directed RNA polymerase beta subunit
MKEDLTRIKKCLTPGTTFHLDTSIGCIMYRIMLPHEIDLTEEVAKQLEDVLHDAAEGVLQQLWESNEISEYSDEQLLGIVDALDEQVWEHDSIYAEGCTMDEWAQMIDAERVKRHLIKNSDMKLNDRFGTRGVISEIIPDDEMPTCDGPVPEIVMSPSQIRNRT